MEARKLPFGKAVSVFWVDSAAHHGWTNPDNELNDTTAIVSLGYVTKTDNDKVVLTSSITKDLGVLCPISIPWVAIFQVQELPQEYDRKIAVGQGAE